LSNSSEVVRKLSRPSASRVAPFYPLAPGLGKGGCSSTLRAGVELGPRIRAAGCAKGDECAFRAIGANSVSLRLSV